MGLTPHEEREIQQIEESLVDSDPGFAARMSSLIRPHPELVVMALCLVIVAVVFGLSAATNAPVSVACAATAAFLAGWCLGRARQLDPKWLLWRVRTATVHLAGAVSRPVRRCFRHLFRRRH